MIPQQVVSFYWPAGKCLETGSHIWKNNNLINIAVKKKLMMSLLQRSHGAHFRFYADIKVSPKAQLDKHMHPTQHWHTGLPNLKFIWHWEDERLCFIYCIKCHVKESFMLQYAQKKNYKLAWNSRGQSLGNQHINHLRELGEHWMTEIQRGNSWDSSMGKCS